MRALRDEPGDWSDVEQGLVAAAASRESGLAAQLQRSDITDPLVAQDLVFFDLVTLADIMARMPRVDEPAK